MNNGIHFISGLPRSGSTLLAALLRQNPRFHAGISSPVGPLLDTLWGAMGAGGEHFDLIDATQREDVLRGLFVAYYRSIQQDKLVFDTNRLWCAKMHLLARLFPQAKVVCCVRDSRWILDSFERQFRKHALFFSKMFTTEQAATVYSRIEAIAAPSGIYGFSLNALREAFYGEYARRLVVIDYEALAREPAATMGFLYDRLQLPPFAHDFEQVAYQEETFDRRLGIPDLHKVSGRVAFNARPTVLPPDIVARFRTYDFWQDPASNANGASVLLYPRTKSGLSSEQPKSPG